MRTAAALILFALAILLTGSAQQPDHPSPYDAEFWKTWGDGQAELSSYDLIQPRYGAPRRGSAVTIFVTETFSRSARVKADPGKHPVSDEFPVMKLNLVKDFQTGVYDYNDMTSAFLALSQLNSRPPGSLTKVSFSGQEWCGHVYHQLLFDARSIRSARHSYFDGEGDELASLPYPAGAMAADALWFWARGMAEPRLEPGQTRAAPLLTALQAVRDSHRPADWVQASFARTAATESITVPAGRFDAELWTVTAGAATWKFWVARDAPHVILRWETSEGEKGELIATTRGKYWEHNKPGGEKQLEPLKLAPRPPRTT
jgi:hypothetical protein